jgi:hypothetical protein
MFLLFLLAEAAQVADVEVLLAMQAVAVAQVHILLPGLNLPHRALSAQEQLE